MLEGEDPRSFLDDLVRGLKGMGGPDRRKKIPNRHRYVGLTPTIAWVLTCRDPSYPVMYDSLDSFARLWDSATGRLAGRDELDLSQVEAYVSLGVGTGDKDRLILDRLLQAGANPFYFPVDISSHMLRLAVPRIAHRVDGRVLPLELDFERPGALKTLAKLLTAVVGDGPILFSFLGNSLGNLEADDRFLTDLAQILRPRDLLALEVALTQAADDEAAVAAAAERSGSRLYNEFVTSALAMYTDLSVDTNWLEFTGTADPSRGITIEGHYINQGDTTIILTLPNRETVPFLAGEGINVLLGRKYLAEALNGLLVAAELAEVSSAFRDEPTKAAPDVRFGLGLTVLRRDAGAARAQKAPLLRVWEE